ncbi:MAG: zf-TFIIB domain-containing protein [Cypionkella sp.]
MRCPIDNETLVMADRGGVEIDYCPKCRGVWLDRGELDKIIERSSQEAPAAQVTPQPAPIYQPEPQAYREAPRELQRRHDHDEDDDHRYGRKKKRRESFLSDIFDF